jgi:hypothetical protein
MQWKKRSFDSKSGDKKRERDPPSDRVSQHWYRLEIHTPDCAIGQGHPKQQ